MSDWRCNLKSYALEVARGNVPGMSSVNKFGHNIEIDSGIAADIWDGGYTVASGGNSLLWVAPTTARTHQIVSTDDNDGKTGSPSSTGARTLRVYGLTGWSTAEVSEDITMDGTTNVATSNAYVIIHRMKVLTKGGTNVNIGDITATADTDSTVTARIRPGQGQTQMAVYGLPSIQTAYMGSYYASIDRTGGGTATADVCVMVNPEPDAELTNFLIKHIDGVLATGTSHLHHPWYTPLVIPGPALIKIQAISGVNNNDVSAGYDLIVVDN